MFDNTQGTLFDLPDPIRNFYHEELRTLPTGNKISSVYKYQDEDGVEQETVRLVDEYIDVSFLVENPRDDLKSWAFVSLAKERGDPESVKYTISKACEAEKWAFHDEYLAWLERTPVLDDSAFLERIDEESEPVFSPALYDAAIDAWQLDEPILAISDESQIVADYHQELAKSTRESVVESNIELFNVVWQVDASGRDNMTSAIAYAERLGMSEDTVRQWILADNSVRETSVSELKSVLNAYTERLDAVYVSYTVWREGSKLELFQFK
ncbi:DUF4376 domain-containing protein [Vibrio sp. ABG19]|uniref:DUF4376 domain-containing protein n=1 Tax=Vibrio sp. ABG19 TaxID=2817385 RepID=UPI00249F2557|nr:DUF4376 domain-containing protein [Vibrio sp. ABG19]WGY45025.1 DUF4376 domain-containing protein [Vibrio sp. ABG19]